MIYIHKKKQVTRRLVILKFCRFSDVAGGPCMFYLHFCIMALDNAISVEFTESELGSLQEGLSIIASVLEGKCISLTPEQRQEFARLGNRTENWSKKTMDYLKSQPGFTPNFINIVETAKDFTARQALRPHYKRLLALTELMDDTLMLLGSDVYSSCVAYYRNVKLMADQNVTGAKTIYEDLSAQFPGRLSAAKTSVNKQ